MNEYEKQLWIAIYTQTFERSKGNQVEANSSANEAVEYLRKSEERFDEE